MFLSHILKRADHSGTLYVPEITGQWGGQPAGVRSAPRADGGRWDSSRARSVTVLECAPPARRGAAAAEDMAGARVGRRDYLRLFWRRIFPVTRAGHWSRSSSAWLDSVARPHWALAGAAWGGRGQGAGGPGFTFSLTQARPWNSGTARSSSLSPTKVALIKAVTNCSISGDE